MASFPILWAADPPVCPAKKNCGRCTSSPPDKNGFVSDFFNFFLNRGCRGRPACLPILIHRGRTHGFAPTIVGGRRPRLPQNALWAADSPPLRALVCPQNGFVSHINGSPILSLPLQNWHNHLYNKKIETKHHIAPAHLSNHVSSFHVST